MTPAQVTGVELREPGKLLIYGTRTQDPLKAASVKLDGVPTVYVHNDFVAPLAPWFDRKEAFFRLVHTGSELPLRATVPGYTIRQVDTTTELPLVATILHACYDTPTPGTDEIVTWTRRPVFDRRVWLWIVDRKEKRPVALGIAETDRVTGEGSLEWVQVLPAFRSLGLGTMLVQELVLSPGTEGRVHDGCRSDEEPLRTGASVPSLRLRRPHNTARGGGPKHRARGPGPPPR